MTLLAHLVPWLQTYGYTVFFPTTVFEGPIVTIVAGFLVSQGYLNAGIVYALAVLGDLVGDTLYYGIGKWGRTQFITRWGRYVGFTTQRLVSLENHFKEHSGKTLIFGKFLHGIGGGILVAAGAAHMPYGKFMWFNLIGTLPKVLVLLLVGFFFGKAYMQFSHYLDYTAWGILILVVVAIFFYTVVMKRIRQLVR